MTTTIVRWLSPLLLCLLLVACSLPLRTSPATAESKLFAQGLDRYIASGDLTTLEQLPLEYPQGAWRTRAESIIAMAEQRHRQQVLLEKKNEELVNCQARKELARCREEKNALDQDIQMLELTLKRLKEALIDTELRTE